MYFNYLSLVNYEETLVYNIYSSSCLKYLYRLNEDDIKIAG